MIMIELTFFNLFQTNKFMIYYKRVSFTFHELPVLLWRKSVHFSHHIINDIKSYPTHSKASFKRSGLRAFSLTKCITLYKTVPDMLACLWYFSNSGFLARNFSQDAAWGELKLFFLPRGSRNMCEAESNSSSSSLLSSISLAGVLGSWLPWWGWWAESWGVCGSKFRSSWSPILNAAGSPPLDVGSLPGWGSNWR